MGIRGQERSCLEVRFRYLADVQKGRGRPFGRHELVRDGSRLPYLTSDYLRGAARRPTLVPVEPTALVASNDTIVLVWDGAGAGEFLRGKPGIVPATSALITLKEPPRTVPPVDPAYFYWACKSHEPRIRDEMAAMTLPRVDGGYLANIRIRVPSLARQRAVAAYLDRETDRLDTLAEAANNMLSLLDEKQEALVAMAVEGELEVGEGQ